MTGRLKAFWSERTGRERAAIALCPTLVALAIAHAYAWLPAARERDRLLARLPELRAEAQAMERDARELETLKAAATASIGLKTAIGRATAASGLADTAIETVQQDSSRIRATIASAQSGHAFAWLAQIQSAGGVRFESVRVTSLGDGERVKVEAMVGAAR